MNPLELVPWPTASLGELTTASRPICYGVLKPGPYDPNGVPLVKIQDLHGGTVTRDRLHYITPELDAEFSRSRLIGGEVLLSIQGTIGRVAICPDYLAGANISRTIARIDPDDRIENRFLLRWLEFVTYADGYETGGSTRQSLNIGTIRTMQVPLPPLAEQQRIVEAIDEHFTRIDAAEDGLGRVVREAELLGHALREAAAFVHPRASLEELLAEPLSNGRSVKTQEGGFPVLRLTAIRNGTIDGTECKSGAWDEAEAKPHLAEIGDFLVARGNGSLNLVGRGGLVERLNHPVAYPDTMIRVRIDSDRMLPAYLQLVWDSRPVRRQVEAMAHTTAGIYKVNQEMLRSLEVPLPSIQDQRAALAAYEAARPTIDRVAGEVATAAQRSTRLRRSLLEAAFSGRLVPERPADESAGVLLERIAGERAGSDPSATRRSRKRVAS